MKAAGGVAPFNITDGRTGEVKAVEWYAPALNTVFYRFDEEEVRFIIVYGRAFSPMSPWGLEGGGPLNAQQVDTLLAYIESIQIEREDCGEGEGDPLAVRLRSPPGRGSGRHRRAGEPRRRGRRVRELRRGTVQPQPRQRRVQLREVPHAGLELGRSRACRGRARSVGT